MGNKQTNYTVKDISTYTMNDISTETYEWKKRYVFMTVLAIMVVFASVSLLVSYQALQAEAYSRYMGVRNVSSEKIAKIIRGVEMNAQNIFNEVNNHHETPEDVIEALKSKADLNLDVRGYFAAFEPNYFPEKGTWFEPYIYQPDQGGFEYRQVGSARHNYMKSPWYVRAKNTGKSFWSDPYYYYDGTSMSGHYCTFIKPLYGANGQLECVCGADMKFEWLAKELEWVDNSSRSNKLLNKYHLMSNFNFYSVIIDKDGTCVAHPGEEPLTITDENMLKNLAQKKGGMAKVKVNGASCTIYYGPIEFVDWNIAVVVPQSDVVKQLLPVALLFLSLVVIGLIIIWWELRK